MKKNKVKLTENGLKKLIKESTAKILKEMETENVPYEAWSEYLHGKDQIGIGCILHGNCGKKHEGTASVNRKFHAKVSGDAT